MLDKWDSRARAPQLPATLPVLCIHGTLDDIAPIALGRELYEALPATRKRFVELEEAGHNDIPYNDPSRYLREASAFLRGI